MTWPVLSFRGFFTGAPVLGRLKQLEAATAGAPQAALPSLPLWNLQMVFLRGGLRVAGLLTLAEGSQSRQASQRLRRSYIPHQLAPGVAWCLCALLCAEGVPEASPGLEWGYHLHLLMGRSKAGGA